MPNEKLQEIGEKLDVSDKEIKDIQNKGTKSKVLKILLHPISILLLSISAFIGGAFLFTYVDRITYPHFSSYGSLIALKKGKKGSFNSKIFLPLIALIAGYFVGSFGLAMMYNVYNRK